MYREDDNIAIHDRAILSLVFFSPDQAEAVLGLYFLMNYVNNLALSWITFNLDAMVYKDGKVHHPNI